MSKKGNRWSIIVDGVTVFISDIQEVMKKKKAYKGAWDEEVEIKPARDVKKHDANV